MLACTLRPARGKAALAFILAAGILDVVALGIVTPVLPALIEQFVGRNAEAGLINGLMLSSWAVLQFFLAPTLGALSDRFGRRPVLLMSTAGLMIDYAILALAPNLAWFVIGRLIGGATSARLTVLNAYLADITPVEHRVRSYGLLGAAMSAGLVGGPLLGGLLGEISPRAPFWAAGALSALTLCYGLFILPESLPPERRSAFIWRRANPIGALSFLRSHPRLSSFALINFLLYFGCYAMHAVYVLYAGSKFHFSAWKVGALYAILGGADMLVQSLLIGPVTRRWGEQFTLVLGLFMGAIAVTCIGLAPTALLFTLATAAYALRMMVTPTLQALSTRCVSESEQGLLQGANWSVASLAGVLAPLFFGAVYSLSADNAVLGPGYQGAAFWMAGFILSIAGVIGLQLWRAPAWIVDTRAQ